MVQCDMDSTEYSGSRDTPRRQGDRQGDRQKDMKDKIFFLLV